MKRPRLLREKRNRRVAHIQMTRLYGVGGRPRPDTEHQKTRRAARPNEKEPPAGERSVCLVSRKMESDEHVVRRIQGLDRKRIRTDANSTLA
jgi:hypothetical protein